MASRSGEDERRPLLSSRADASSPLPPPPLPTAARRPRPLNLISSLAITLGIFSLCLIFLFWLANALIGLGTDPYSPLCAYSCNYPLQSVHLECTDLATEETTGECYAADKSYLTSLAYCISVHCSADHVDADVIEAYWTLAANDGGLTAPKWDYSTTLAMVTTPPIVSIDDMAILNHTGLVTDDAYLGTYNGIDGFTQQQNYAEQFGLTIVLVTIGIPIFATMLTYIPLYRRAEARLEPYMVWPAIIKRHHIQPWTLGVAPTAGQSVFLALLLTVTTIFTVCPYTPRRPNSWYTTTYEELMAYACDRTGILALALTPLTILLAGRNQLLLRLTDWPYSTYLLYHRWVGRMAVLQAILHGILETALWLYYGLYTVEITEPYFLWGIAATVAGGVMCGLGAIYFRRRAYEVFLVLHILLAVLWCVGIWFHLAIFTDVAGFKEWMYASAAMWGFDRAARVARIFRNGAMGCRTEITELGGGMVRVDVPDAKCVPGVGEHVYLHLPFLARRLPWEAHPFSIVPIPTPPSPRDSATASRLTSLHGTTSTGSTEKKSPAATLSPSETRQGIRIYARRHAGLTSALHPSVSPRAFIDGPYADSRAMPSSLAGCSSIVLLAGGVGVAGVLGIAADTSLGPRCRLFWSVRRSGAGLVRDVVVSGALSGVRGAEVRITPSATADQAADGDAETPDIDLAEMGAGQHNVRICTGERVEVGDLLAAEGVGDEGTVVGVVVCGPGAFCDDLRAAVVRIGRRGGGGVRLFVEGFGW